MVTVWNFLVVSDKFQAMVGNFAQRDY